MEHEEVVNHVRNILRSFFSLLDEMPDEELRGFIQRITPEMSETGSSLLQQVGVSLEEIDTTTLLPEKRMDRIKAHCCA